MPDDFRSKKLTLGDIRVRTSGDMTAVVWKDKHNVHILTNMHDPPAEGNFCDESGNTRKPESVEHYNRHMGYINKSDRMTNSYIISYHTWKWMKKLFFHLLDLIILNSHILLTSCGSKLSHRDFRLIFVKNMVALAGPQPHPQQSVSRPSALATRTGRLEESSHQHWSTTIEKRMGCIVSHARTKSAMLDCVYKDASKTITQRHSCKVTMRYSGDSRLKGTSGEKVCNNFCSK
jgi:hypothetical protein